MMLSARAPARYANFRSTFCQYSIRHQGRANGVSWLPPRVYDIRASVVRQSHRRHHRISKWPALLSLPTVDPGKTFAGGRGGLTSILNKLSTRLSPQGASISTVLGRQQRLSRHRLRWKAHPGYDSTPVLPRCFVINSSDSAVLPSAFCSACSLLCTTKTYHDHYSL